jgi:hypothetical protein
MALQLHEGAARRPLDHHGGRSNGGLARWLVLFTLSLFAAGFVATAAAAWLVSLLG